MKHPLDLRIRRGAVPALLLVLPVLGSGCHDSDDDDSTLPKVFQGDVLDPAGDPIAGATVFLVPAEMIDQTAILPADVLSGAAEDRDEPLEDLVAASGASFQQDVTDASGGFRFSTVDDGRYFVYVQPDPLDAEHLPGGNLCRSSMDAVELRGLDAGIALSSSPPDTAVYIGMSACLACHPDYATQTATAHRIGFRVPGENSLLQDTSGHPQIDDSLALFPESLDHTGGTPIYHSDYDPTGGFDKFRTTLDDPTGTFDVSAILWLWRNVANDDYMITIENVGNPGDPSNLTDLVVELTYGGAVYKQRFMVEWPGREGLYPLLQYQTEGDEDVYERTRHTFRDYHLDYYWDDGGTPANLADDVIAAPPLDANAELNCMACHAPGYSQFTDVGTGEILCDSVEDPIGEYDIDGDGFLNDLNVGCESCHGPGSAHSAALGANGRLLVRPELLTPSREVMLCARCHDSYLGNGTVVNGQPLNALDEFPPPGISRAAFLADHVTRNGPDVGDYWPDFTHAMHNQMHASDFLRAKHYRNARELVSCSSCHDVHGGTGFDHGLIADPDATDSPLCMTCHAGQIASTAVHTEAVLGVAHGGFFASCVECHMTKTAKSGAGRYGQLLATPTGTPADADTTYFENDITSHLFDVIPKSAVQGETPGTAMPVPYTNACGTCHDASDLHF
jgi:hypothetical protein